jgi:FAD/FMN-containing dehydrogenase
LLSTHGPSGVGIETLIRWSDEPYPVHTHFLTDEEKSKLRLRKANPLAAAAVAALSKDIVGSWSDLGGVHLQIGRKYPYLETRLPNTSALLRDLKDRFDPDCILNPENLFVSLM